MTVHCPHCGTGYLLPDHLLGPRGARVRCPNCRRPFVVLREGEAAASATATATATPTPIPSPTVVSAAPAAEAASPAETVSPMTGSPMAEASAQGLSEVVGGAAEEAPTPTAESLAREILESLAERLGGKLADARARGRVLAEIGPDIMKAYDEFRARAGADAPREAFRAVLRDHWGVDLL